MATNQTFWTPEQRQAVAGTFIDTELTMVKVLQAAAKGELTDSVGEPLKPFNPPKNTADAWVKRERERRANLPQPPRQQISGALDTALGLLVDELDHEKGKEAGARDVTRIKAAMAGLKDADSLRKSLDASPPEPDSAPGGAPEPNATPLGRLSDAAEKRLKATA